MKQSSELLQAVVDATVAAVDPERIVLFGSRARGDARDDSDVDLLVVERESFTPEHNRQGQLERIRRALWGVPIPVDVLVYSSAEVDEWRESPNHVIARSLREGVTLYERS